MVGVHDYLKGQRPYAIVVPEMNHVDRSEELSAEIRNLVRRQIGPIASLGGVEVVAALPKTRSGKIVRSCLRQILDGDEPDVPPTIENISVVDDLIRALTKTPDSAPS